MTSELSQSPIFGYIDKLETLINEHLTICSDTEISKGLEILKSLREQVTDLQNVCNSDSIISKLDLSLLEKPWQPIGSGNFGRVFKSRLKGSTVAIKVFKDEAKAQVRESKLLRYLSHENIISYRGMGYLNFSDRNVLDQKMINDDEEENEEDYPKMFFVMEYISTNLYRYIINLESHETRGLSLSKAWDVGQQITSALSYLHAEKIVHRDLKPDNILIQGPNKLLIKLADFGLAWQDNQINIQQTRYGTTSGGESGAYINIRWGPPEFRTSSASTTIRSFLDYQKGDMYCFGLIMVFTISGLKPWANLSSSRLDDEIGMNTPSIPNEFIPKGPVGEIVTYCIRYNPQDRPGVDDVISRCFQGRNPYLAETDEGELFSCGFMTKTDIFVADSCTTDESKQIGFFESGIRPLGYDHSDLKCSIFVDVRPNRDRYDDWDKEEEYIVNYHMFKKQANEKIIDNNPTVALKSLTFARPGEKEAQRVELLFKQSEYVHHRAMRKIWMGLSDKQKQECIPNKGEVNPFFSNTFGLHVAILTNEGPNKPQYFVFPQRAKRAGMSAPGAFTCGAVESASTPDYADGVVDLVNTAVRGVREELGLDLTGSDRDAICLTTIYLKVDTHEWGLCGYVDLTDDRIKPENQISAENLKDRFSSGPKDKFEHQTLTFVPFTLEAMVDFVFENHNNFASSAKLVVVKVLQAFFGWSRVQKEFESRHISDK